MDAQLTDFRARGSKPPKLPMPDPAELEERFAIALVIFTSILTLGKRHIDVIVSCAQLVWELAAHASTHASIVCGALMLFARACWLLIAGARRFIVESFGFFHLF